MDLRSSTFLVTGAASGLGAAVMRHFSDAGAHVVAVDRDAATLDRAVAGHAGVLRVSADVTDAAAMAAAVDAAVGEFGHLDGAVSCAGIGIAIKTLSGDTPHDLDLFRKVIEINLVGTFNVIRLAAAAMAKNRPNAEGERGVIVNTASIAAFEGQIGQAAYAASKGGVVGMTLPIARDLARYGIRVVTIAPGLFDTPLLASLPQEAREALGKQVPFPPRLGRPAEYAQLVASIVANPMLNGETIRLDGALRMTPK